jgi:hypothetical protein
MGSGSLGARRTRRRWNPLDQRDDTLSSRVEAADGTLLHINDTVTPAIEASGPVTDVVSKLIAVAPPR